MQAANFSTRFVADTATLVVAGDVDDLALPQLETALDEATETAQAAVTVDLSDVEYLPSMALSVLVRCWRRATEAGHDLVLQAAPGSIAERVLHMTGMPYQLQTGSLSES